MKIAFYILLLISVLAGGFFLLNSGGGSLSVTPSDRFYVTPTVYLSNMDNLQVGMDLKRAGFRLEGDYISQGVPEWTLTEPKTEYENYVLGNITILPAATSIENSEENEFEKFDLVGESSGYKLYIQSLGEGDTPTFEHFIAEKVLDNRTDLVIRFEILDSKWQKYETLDEKRAFAERLTSNLTYDSTYLGELADTFKSFKSNRDVNPADFNDEELEALANSSDRVKSSIYYSMFAETDMAFTANQVLRQISTLDNFCSNMLSEPNLTRLLPQSFTCASSETNLLFSIHVDDGLNYCTDSTGFSGLVAEDSENVLKASCI